MEVKIEPRHSILLLTYNRVDLLNYRAKEIERIFGTRPDVELFILDNGSTDGTDGYLRDGYIDEWNELHDGLRIVYHILDKNIGFGPAFNQAAKKASGDVLYFLSNDVTVLDDFIDPIVVALSAAPNALLCQQVIDWHAGWNQFGTEKINYPSGHFIACRRPVWQQLEGFDERFVPNDYEDVDMGMKCRELGIPLVALPGLPLKHAQAGTIGYTPERYQNTILQRKRFAEKWDLPNVPEVP